MFPKFLATLPEAANDHFADKLYDLDQISRHMSGIAASPDQAAVGIDDLRTELEEAESVYEQADILHHIYVTRYHFLYLELKRVGSVDRAVTHRISGRGFGVCSHHLFILTN